METVGDFLVIFLKVMTVYFGLKAIYYGIKTMLKR